MASLLSEERLQQNVMDVTGLPFSVRGLTLIEDSFIMPAQWAAAPRLTWAQELMYAVLASAWHCASVAHVAQGRSRHARRILVEELLWVESDSTAWPFAFLNVCSHLGLDSDDIRRAFLKAYPLEQPITEKEYCAYWGTPLPPVPSPWEQTVWPLLKRSRVRSGTFTCEIGQHGIDPLVYYRSTREDGRVRIACEPCLRTR